MLRPTIKITSTSNKSAQVGGEVNLPRAKHIQTLNIIFNILQKLVRGKML